MKTIAFIGYIILFLFLTILTQIGGLVLITCMPLFRFINRKIRKVKLQALVKAFTFVGIYLLVTFAVIPFIAPLFGRVALPVMKKGNIQPLNIMTCILNRHYVNPELKEIMGNVGREMNEKHSGTPITYLDANFPFIDKFPLIPHLSHNDGKKLDLAFYYSEQSTSLTANGEAPSFIGYGVYEGPNFNETDRPSECAGKGYWQYGIIQYLVPDWSVNKNLVFDPVRTKYLIELLIKERSIGKIFIEPHLKDRLQLYSDKVRFHGCRAVRHDDHIHLQL